MTKVSKKQQPPKIVAKSQLAMAVGGEATVGNDGERRFTPGKTYVTDIT